MTISVTKPSVNLREKLNELDQPQGLKGTELLRADTVAEARNLIGAGRKNLIINGAMQINQRGTTATGGSAALHYGACDRWRMYQENTATAYTLSQDSNSPDGFGSSYKVDVTTADSTLDAADRVDLIYRFEGNELQHLKKGTASAESVTLSFWVSSPKTGTHIIEFYDNDNARHICQAYTVSSADTWEQKTLTYAGDTTGAFGDDSNMSLQFSIWLMAGSTFSSGTLDTSWGSVTAANRAVGQVNVMDSTSNNFYITGVQLEVGSVATDFEHRSYGEELALCQRYYLRQTGSGRHFIGGNGSLSTCFPTTYFPVAMRTNPSFSYSSLSDFRIEGITGGGQAVVTGLSTNAYTSGSFTVQATSGGSTSGTGGQVLGNGGGSSSWTGFDAEL